jgi:hypothetical protein
MGNCRGERAICSREWLTAPPYVLLPQQEVTELLKLRLGCNEKEKGHNHFDCQDDAAGESAPAFARAAPEHGTVPIFRSGPKTGVPNRPPASCFAIQGVTFEFTFAEQTFSGSTPTHSLRRKQYKSFLRQKSSEHSVCSPESAAAAGTIA